MAALLAFCAISESAGAEVILRLKSGDRLSGTVLSEDNGRIILSNNWAAELSVPLDAVAQRQLISPKPPQSAVATNLPEAPVFVVAGPPGPLRPPPRFWSGEAQVGLDFRYGAQDRQLFHGKLKLDYERPYEADPALIFRNLVTYRIEYGRTEGIESSDRMDGMNKTEWDVSRRWFIYSLFGAGYDNIRRVDAQYEAGPGIGYHLVTRTNLTVNVETGFSYQAQFRSDSEDVRDVSYRLAQDFAWKIGPRMSLSEKIEFFPRVNFDEYRIRFETALRYDLWWNLSLNFSVLDLFDTRPAPNVSHNELQVRSALGVKF